MGMMGGMAGGLANGAAFDIMTVAVGTKKADSPRLGTFPAIKPFDPKDVVNYNSPRTFSLAMGMMMSWTINGRVFNDNNMMEVAPDEKVLLNTTEAWEWINNGPIPHPMHIHNVQFQVLQRQGGIAGSDDRSRPACRYGLEGHRRGRPGERVRVATRFAPYAGLYMYHCHILEHEDMTMMRNNEIVKK